MKRLEVEVKQGWIRGCEYKNDDGVAYAVFKGIPYAAPPVGDLRFQDPQPPESWTGIKDCTQEAPCCPQMNRIDNEIFGNEDCLTLNVATKSLVRRAPVMVWISPGRFVTANASVEYKSPEFLMNADVVYASMNYRVGVFGFLQLHHELAAGNMGMKDQVSALKWIQENIAQFGGDPNNVTIFGYSSGSLSVHYHLISPLSKGLFHKAIMHSGVAFNTSASAARTTEIAHRLVAALGKDTTDPIEIVQFLRTIPAYDLVKAQIDMMTWKERITWTWPFWPTIDRESPNPFLPRCSMELDDNGFDVPVILGYVSDEGLILLTAFSLESETKLYSTIDEDDKILVPGDLVDKAPSKVGEISKKIRQYYFGNSRISRETRTWLTRCLGDQRYVIRIHRVVEARMNKRPATYLYKFSYDSPNPIIKTRFKYDITGTCHGEDVTYVMRLKALGDIGKYAPGSEQRVVSDRMVKMWTNFATYGDPTPKIDDLITVKWKPVDRFAKHYLEINSELTMGVNPDEDRIYFWKSIFSSCE